MFDFIKSLLDKHNIKNITSNSKRVFLYASESSFPICFFAISGSSFNGHEYIDENLLSIVSLLFVEDQNIISKFPKYKEKIIVVNDSQLAYSLAVSIKHHIKDENLCIIASTGTNGKTSTNHYIRELLYLLKNQANTVLSLGTTGIYIDDKKIASNINNLTSYDIESFFALKKFANEKEINYMTLEASSHGIKQKRFGNSKFHIVNFISFSPDHLDYHNSMDNYLDAKLDIIRFHMNDNTPLVISSDIESKYFQKIIKLAKIYKRKLITIGSLNNHHNIDNKKFLSLENYVVSDSEGDSGNNLRSDFSYLFHIDISEIKFHPEGIEFSFLYKTNEYFVATKVNCDIQIVNLVIAISNLLYLGFDLMDILDLVPCVSNVYGRMSKIRNIDKHIFIDYAHTEDALLKISLSLRKFMQKNQIDGRLILLFGCGGDRDMSKRSKMGEIANDYADLIIITDDNPRNENPMVIRAMITVSIDQRKYIEIADRKKAISYAVDVMEDNDVLLLAGKGHEQYQIVKDKNYYFNEEEVIYELFKKLF